MVISKILSKLNLEELIGTEFENLINVKKIKEGEIIIDIPYNKLGAFYVLKGTLELVSYSKGGKEFYRYLTPGDMIGVGECFFEKNKNELEKKFGTEIHILENSEVAYLPFFKLISLKIENKDKILRKLIVMTVEEKEKESNHYLGKILHSDEEFIIKVLDQLKMVKTPSTKYLAKGLNMNIRNLQRILKKLEKMDIIKKDKGVISIKNLNKFDSYNKKLKDH